MPYQNVNLRAFADCHCHNVYLNCNHGLPFTALLMWLNVFRNKLINLLHYFMNVVAAPTSSHLK